MKNRTLSCSRCLSQVPERATVCVGCQAEIIDSNFTAMLALIIAIVLWLNSSALIAFMVFAGMISLIQYFHFDNME